MKKYSLEKIARELMLVGITKEGQSLSARILELLRAGVDINNSEYYDAPKKIAFTIKRGLTKEEVIMQLLKDANAIKLEEKIKKELTDWDEKYWQERIKSSENWLKKPTKEREEILDDARKLISKLTLEEKNRNDKFMEKIRQINSKKKWYEFWK